MNISDRILQYLDFKGITKNKFYVTTGLSNGFLDKKPNIGSDKIEIILSVFPDINVFWLVTGRGDMLYNTEKKNQNTEIGTLVFSTADFFSLLSNKDKRIEELCEEVGRLKSRLGM